MPEITMSVTSAVRRPMEPLTVFTAVAANRPSAHAGLPAVVDGIGSVSFWPRLIDYLEHVAGGEHCIAWELRDGRMQEVGAASWNGADHARRRLHQYSDPKYWRRDPALTVVRRHGQPDRPVMVVMDPRRVPDSLIRESLYGQDHIRERVVLCQPSAEATLGLSVVRGEDRGPFSDDQLDALGSVADTLISIVAKHRQIASQRNAYNPVSEDRLAEIQQALQHGESVRLTAREAQVCARLICGRAISAIAAELGVGTETVETYRKRAYARLGVSSKQELLLRYLGYC
ncbi:helix-turn-helix transcriptional regulator [Caldimonas thermodepolymerans]|nr:LuxR C-terminal-related transcriptional regulator [Caldimonas thermodepolymerans]